MNLQRSSIVTQPAPRLLVIRARQRDEPPEVARMIEAPQVHELMNQHVIPNRLRHQNEPPVQTDVSRGRTRPPAGALIAYAYTRQYQPVPFGECTQANGKLTRGTSPQLADFVGCVDAPDGLMVPGACLLTLNPRTLLLDKKLGMAAGSPARQRNPHGPVGAHAKEITTGSGVTDEFHETISIVPRHGF
jgi:hypothetical protein